MSGLLHRFLTASDGDLSSTSGERAAQQRDKGAVRLMYHLPPACDGPIHLEHHVVDELPHGQAVAIRDEDGHIDVYLSRAHSLDRIAADLSIAVTALSNLGYRLAS